jgi:hypothetical protein
MTAAGGRVLSQPFLSPPLFCAAQDRGGLAQEREAGRFDAGAETLEKPGFQQIPAKASANVDERWRIRRCGFEQERQSMQKALAKKVETVTLKDLAAELVDTTACPKVR